MTGILDPPILLSSHVMKAVEKGPLRVSSLVLETPATLLAATLDMPFAY